MCTSSRYLLYQVPKVIIKSLKHNLNESLTHNLIFLLLILVLERFCSQLEVWSVYCLLNVDNNCNKAIAIKNEAHSNISILIKVMFVCLCVRNHFSCLVSLQYPLLKFSVCSSVCLSVSYTQILLQ